MEKRRYDMMVCIIIFFVVLLVAFTNNRFRNAFLVGLWVLVNPLSVANFDVLTKLLDLMLNVGKSKRHMMTKISIVDIPNNKEVSKVSIWVGSGENSCPTNRIKELLEERDVLESTIVDLEEEISILKKEKI